MGTYPTPQATALVLARVRERRPRVHCLMNTVVQKFTADGLAALGAIPSMTGSIDEVEAFVTKADALAVNLGTLDEERRRAIQLGVDTARGKGKPWIIDPVHCDYSPGRLVFAQCLIAQGPSALRGNADEIRALGDTGAGLVIETGRIDRLVRGDDRIEIANGHPWMAQVTGTGCLSGALIAAFMTVEPDPLAASAAAMLVVGVAAEMAAEHASGPGSFGVALLDALAAVGKSDIVSRGKVTHEKA